MRNLLLGGLITLMVLSGCGRKEVPQADTSEPLRIVDLQSAKEVSILQLTFTILGGTDYVGYQIDRAEFDEICDCLTPWQRTFEKEPLPKQKAKILVHNLKLLTHKREFAFRIRAVDSAGNLSPWSAPMRGRADNIRP